MNAPTKKPKMIMFDMGHTLLCEPGWNAVCGNAALLRLASSNPRGCTIDDVTKAAHIVFGEHFGRVRSMGYEIPAQSGNRLLYDSLGIKFDLSPLELETIFWDAASYGEIMPQADVIIDYLAEKGIRSGVVSNLMWSGDALRIRLDRLLPRNCFEFVIASSDYMLRKPAAMLFEVALRKAGLEPSDVWYCGDNPVADIEGASAAGIFPVWYDNVYERLPDHPDVIPNCNHLHIRQWSELISILEESE